MLAKDVTKRNATDDDVDDDDCLGSDDDWRRLIRMTKSERMNWSKWCPCVRLWGGHLFKSTTRLNGWDRMWSHCWWWWSFSFSACHTLGRQPMSFRCVVRFGISMQQKQWFDWQTGRWMHKRNTSKLETASDVCVVIRIDAYSAWCCKWNHWSLFCIRKIPVNLRCLLEICLRNLTRSNWLRMHWCDPGDVCCGKQG